MDAHGKSLHDDLAQEFDRNFAKIIKGVELTRM